MATSVNQFITILMSTNSQGGSLIKSEGEPNKKGDILLPDADVPAHIAYVAHARLDSTDWLCESEGVIH